MIYVYTFVIYFLIGIFVMTVLADWLFGEKENPLNSLSCDQYISVLILSGFLWLPLFIFVFVEGFKSGEIKKALDEFEKEEEYRKNRNKKK